MKIDVAASYRTKANANREKHRRVKMPFRFYILNADASRGGCVGGVLWLILA